MTLQKLSLQAPGLVGSLCTWLNTTAYYQQPVLSLAASLAFVAALKAHRVQSPTGLRTNLYVAGVAPASSGKGHALEQLKRLVRSARLSHLMAGKPVSDSGLLKTLQNSNGRRLILWDEFGLALAEMTSWKASGHKAAILSCLMDLFSSSASTYFGKEYADHDGKMKRVDIEQPCLSLYGVSTPTRFFEALSSGHASDGFVSRWLLFESDPGEINPKRPTLAEPPDWLVGAVQGLEAAPINRAPKGNLDLTIDPPVLHYESDTAARWVKDLSRDFEAKKSQTKNDLLRSLWGRAAEHTIKIALTIEDSSTHISAHSLNYAEQLVKALVGGMIRAVEENVADNEAESQKKKVLKIIKSATMLTRTQLGQRARFLRGYELEQILSDLELEQEITCDKHDLEGSGRKSWCYRAGC